MEKMTTTTLADDLALAQEKILNDQQELDVDRIDQVIDSLGVLTKPVVQYLDAKQETYDAESDHKLTMLQLNQPIKALHDRILTNHVDGYVDQSEIHFTYNHEDPYEDGAYDPEKDFHVLVYSLKVIGAVQSIAPEEMKKVLSPDAVLSLGIAAHALADRNA